MADPFLAEIRLFPFNFAPRGWAFCQGQLLPLSQNTALFSLVGTTYGGNGTNTFGLPDLRGRMAMHPGQGPGLNDHSLGETGGAESVPLLEAEMPTHRHGAVAVGDAASPSVDEPQGAYLGMSPARPYTASTSDLVDMATSTTGGGQPHNNLHPYLVLNFCIAMQGVFPPRP